MVCLGRKSKATLVGTVLARDKGGIVAGRAPLSLPLSLCFELWAAVHTGRNTSCCLVTQEEGVTLSFWGLEIHWGCSWNIVFSPKGLLNPMDFDLYKGIVGPSSYSQSFLKNSLLELCTGRENNILWYLRAQQDPTVCMFAACITATPTRPFRESEMVT